MTVDGIENNIPSTEEEVSRETKRVAEALAANNYPANFIHNGRQLNRQQEMNDTIVAWLSFPTPEVFPRELQHSPRFQHQGRP